MKCPILTISIVNIREVGMTKNANDRCSVCGLSGFIPYDEQGYPTYNICPCCSFEAGNEYDHRTDETGFKRLRDIWINEMKAQWWKKPPPEGWCYREQLEAANLI